MDCTLPSDGVGIAKADIIEIGVGSLKVLIASFLIALATIGAIICGYLTNSLYEAYLNDLSYKWDVQIDIKV